MEKFSSLCVPKDLSFTEVLAQTQLTARTARPFEQLLERRPLVRSWGKRTGGTEAAGGPVAGPRDMPRARCQLCLSGLSVPHREPRSRHSTVTGRACLACSAQPWWLLPAGNRPPDQARGLATCILLPRADVTRPWQGPLRTGHLTCVCFDFVVPAWKLEPPVREINKMDMTLILQCYYQQGESASVQLPEGPYLCSQGCPSSRTKPAASFLLRRACGRGLPGLTENTFPARGYVTVLFVSRANSLVFRGSSLRLAK